MNDHNPSKHLSEKLALPAGILLIILSLLTLLVMTPSEINNQKITDEIQFELKEAAQWFGSWDELRKVIDELEANENEAAAERHYSGGSDAWSGGFADNH